MREIGVYMYHGLSGGRERPPISKVEAVEPMDTYALWPQSLSRINLAITEEAHPCNKWGRMELVQHTNVGRMRAKLSKA